MRNWGIVAIIAATLCLTAAPVDSIPTYRIGNVIVAIYDWTADASHNAEGVTDGAINGTLLRAVTVPDSTNVPSDNYDIEFSEVFEWGATEVAIDADIDHSMLRNRDTANTELATFFPDYSDWVSGGLKMNISRASAVDTAPAKGRIIAWFWNEPLTTRTVKQNTAPLLVEVSE